MSAWRTCRVGINDLDLTNEPACYVVYIDSHLTYVGQTNNLRSRVSAHGINVGRYSNNIETPWGWGRDVTIKYRQSRKYGDWAMVELRLIRRLQPNGNVMHRTKEALCCA